jgi:prevent-host-death family protein
MSLHNIHEAKSQLSRLIEQAEQGKEVIIAKAGKPVVKLVPYQKITSQRKGGQWQGKIKIKAGFDKLPKDIAAAFGMD